MRERTRKAGASEIQRRIRILTLRMRNATRSRDFTARLYFRGRLDFLNEKAGQR
jgi:hypothetical protein